jgi:hypothetical protein
MIKGAILRMIPISFVCRLRLQGTESILAHSDSKIPLHRYQILSSFQFLINCTNPMALRIQPMEL